MFSFQSPYVFQREVVGDLEAFAIQMEFNFSDQKCASGRQTGGAPGRLLLDGLNGASSVPTAHRASSPSGQGVPLAPPAAFQLPAPEASAVALRDPSLDEVPVPAIFVGKLYTPIPAEK
jgi:hypothetical protein